MSYSVFIEDNHVYVKYLGVVDALDIVQLTADEVFINNFRRLQKVIHDFSMSDEVSLGAKDMQEIALLSNVESNFTEKLVGIVIPKSQEELERSVALSEAIKAPGWTILIAKNYADAITML